ncbi:alpha-amylase-like [Asterias rubens]|uniref:alpha-amylase-like n=1 Tax=Asterias rubens TaxID=7604 RepID=UPI0014558DDD|nr:alpha-amylase-like [Asterias rubens]
MAASLMLVLAALSVVTCASYLDPHMLENRQTIVFMMGWNWADIAEECERYLGPNGFGGVQIMPANEHAIDVIEGKRTWFERYQPVSYKLESASGSEDELRDMVKRCNEVGVRVYADVVINHMAPNDYSTIGKGSAGSSFDMSTLSYPAVPYAALDFNVHNNKCPSSSGAIEDFGDKLQVRYCNLFGFPDLDTSVAHVRISIVDYLNKLIDVGVAGFFVAMAENIWPEDLDVMFNSLEDLNQEYFEPGVRPFISQRVRAAEGFPVKPSEYFSTGRVTEFAYGRAVSESFRGTIKTIASLENLQVDFNLMPSTSAFVFVDSPLLQRSSSSSSFREPGLSTMANAFMLAYPYGLTRVMSSYEFTEASDGPPTDEDGKTLPPVIETDSSCGNGWVCEHRWARIRNLVGFQNASADQPLANFWSNGNQQIAFGRGDKAFIVFNNEGNLLSQKLPTGLPEGKYCDVYNGQFDPQLCTCSGPTITVDGSGFVLFELDNSDTQVVAIHTNALVKDVNKEPGPGSTTATTTLKSATKPTSGQSPSSTTTPTEEANDESVDIIEAATVKPSVKPTQVPTSTKEQGTGDLTEAVTETPTTQPTQVSTSTKVPAEPVSSDLPEAVTEKTTMQTTQVPTSTKVPTGEPTGPGSSNLPEAVTEKTTMQTTEVPTSTKVPKEQGSTDLPEAVTKKPAMQPTVQTSTKEPTEGAITTTSTPTPMNRTMIFLHKDTEFGQFMFLRGGISHDLRSGCTVDAYTSACAISIRHHPQGDNPYFTAWQTGDNYLDWYGAERGQGTHDDVQAGGTPMIWTTNNPSNGAEVSVNGYGYTPLNQWGDNYWMVDIDVDCSKTEGGWFEMKGFLTNAGSSGWENDVSQEENCAGSAGGSRPHSSNNHFARCGFVNVFRFGQNECIIDTLN